MKQLLIATLVATAFALPVSAKQPLNKAKDFDKFAQKMEIVHNFDRQEIKEMLNNTPPLQDVLKLMYSRQTTTMQYDEYERWYINERRINNGVAFWIEYHDALDRAEHLYGVPPILITALIGVETNYGGYIGKHKVVESLITLGFYGPRRQDYFKYELEHFLVTAREYNWKHEEIVGSYAGAIGIPQFMPSNIKKFAVDFDHDGQVDLVTNKVDAIGSVGNYLQQAGWARGEPVAVKVGKNDRKGCTFVLKTLPGPEPIRWKCMHNYQMIKRYNPSDNYAMTIFTLSEKIKLRRAGDF